MTILQRMLHFIQNFEYYVMFEVLEPNWISLEKKLKSVRKSLAVLTGDICEKLFLLTACVWYMHQTMTTCSF